MKAKVNLFHEIRRVEFRVFVKLNIKRVKEFLIY